MDVERVVDNFISQNMIQPATSFSLDALKEIRLPAGAPPQNEPHPHTSSGGRHSWQ
jgi:hypothetical protein